VGVRLTRIKLFDDQERRRRMSKGTKKEVAGPGIKVLNDQLQKIKVKFI
jgi:hypothetical protein